MKKISILIVSIIFLTGIMPLFAQSGLEKRLAETVEKQRSYRSEIESLERQLRTYRERLEFATNRYEQTYQQFEELNRMIALQKEKLRKMRLEQQHINEELELTQRKLEQLESRLNQMIEEYKQTLTYVYKTGRTTEAALILASSSINELLIRSYYLGKFDDHRKEQAAEIDAAKQEFENQKERLEATRNRNEKALIAINNETDELEEKQEQQKKNVELLRRDRNNLQNQLKTVQQQVDEFSRALNDLILEEERIRKAEEERLRKLADARQIEDENERRVAEARYSQPLLREGMVGEDELLAYEDKFRDLEGNLPWPVQNGTITEKFGVRVHPIFSTETNNLGVEIATSSQTAVRVVSDGYVFGIEPLLGFGEVIFVNHGNYKTAYGNLSSLYVRKGQNLRQGDILGLSGDNNSIRGETVYFLIRDGSQYVDPETWLQAPVQ